MLLNSDLAMFPTEQEFTCNSNDTLGFTTDIISDMISSQNTPFLSKSYYDSKAFFLLQTYPPDPR